MATFNDAGAWTTATRVDNDTRYNDDDATIFAGGTNYGVFAGHLYSAPNITATNDTVNFTAPQCIVTFRQTTGRIGGGAGTGTAWDRGDFSVTDGTFNILTSDMVEWPGFSVRGNARPTINLTNTVLRAPNSSSVSWQFDGISPNTEIAGVQVENGIFIWPVGFADLINITVSADAADDASVSGQTRWRVNAHTDDISAFWDGWFSCDFRNWTATTNTDFSFNLNDDAFVNDRMAQFYIVDGQYSQDRIDNGIILRNSDFSPKTFYAGQSWNPAFIDSGDGTEIADFILGHPNNALHEMQATQNRLAAIPRRTGATATAGNNGYIIETGQVDLIQVAPGTDQPVRITIADEGAAPIGNLPGWSYTHVCYNNRAVVRHTSQRANFAQAMVFEAGSKHNIGLGAEGNVLNGLTFAQAQTERQGSIANFDNMYAVVKSEAVREQDVEVPFVIEGTGLTSLGDWTFEQGVSTFFGSGTTSTVTARMAATWSGGDLFNTITSTGTTFANAQTVNGMRFLGTTDFTNATLGTGNSIGGAASGLATDAQFRVEDGATLTYPAATTELDYTLVTPPATGTVTIAGGGTIEIAGVAGASQARFQAAADGTTITFAPPRTTINIDTTAGGFYAIVNSAGTDIPVTAFAAGDNVSQNFEVAAGTTLDVYIKYNSDIATRVVYQEQRIQFTTDADGGVETVRLPTPVPSALVGQLETTNPANITLTPSTSGAVGSRIFTPTITNSTAEESLTVSNPFIGQNLAVRLANDEEYFQAYFDAATRAVDPVRDPIIDYRVEEVINWDTARVTFASGNNDGTNQLQHVIQNWQPRGSDAFSLSRSGSPEVLPIVSGTAPLSVVVEALDGSATATRVTAIAGDVDRIDARVQVMRGDRLLGIRPQTPDTETGPN